MKVAHCTVRRGNGDVTENKIRLVLKSGVTWTRKSSELLELLRSAGIPARVIEVSAGAYYLGLLREPALLNRRYYPSSYQGRKCNRNPFFVLQRPHSVD